MKYFISWRFTATAILLFLLIGCAREAEKIDNETLRKLIIENLTATFGQEGRYTLIDIHREQDTGYIMTVLGQKEKMDSLFFHLRYQHKKWDTVNMNTIVKPIPSFSLYDAKFLHHMPDNIRSFEKFYNNKFETQDRHVTSIKIEKNFTVEKDKIRIEYNIKHKDFKPGATAAHNEQGQPINIIIQ